MVKYISPAILRTFPYLKLATNALKRYKQQSKQSIQKAVAAAPTTTTAMEVDMIDCMKEEEILSWHRTKKSSSSFVFFYSAFDLIPLELQVEILGWLTVEDLANARLVSKAWYSLSRNSAVWHTFYARNFDCDREASNDADLLFWALKANKIPVVHYMLRRNPSLIESADRAGGFSPLYRAAQRGYSEMTKLLVERGAKLDSCLGDGSTPFYIACQENRLEVAKYLADQGCNIECVFLSGFTPMYIASEMGHLEIIKLLVGKGSNVNVVAERGATPLYIASQNGHFEVVEFLVSNGANMEAVFNECYKPLYIAQSRGHTKIVQLLKQNGAQVTGLWPVL